MPSQYFIRVRGRVLGPYDEQKLKSLAARGQFGSTHEVSEDGREWSRASNYPELFRSQTAGAPSAGNVFEQPATASISSQASGANHAAEATGTGTADFAAAIPVAPARPHRTAEWLYSRDGTQHGPVSLLELQSLIASGYVGADDLVWTSGMGNWTSVVQVPTLANHLDGGIVGNLPEHLVRPLGDVRPWILFFAVLVTLCAVAAVGSAVYLLVNAAKLRGEPVASALAGFGTAGAVAAALAAIAAYLLFVLAGNLRRYVEVRDDATLAGSLQTLRKLVQYGGIVSVVLLALLTLAAVYLTAIT